MFVDEVMIQFYHVTLSRLPPSLSDFLPEVLMKDERMKIWGFFLTF